MTTDAPTVRLEIHAAFLRYGPTQPERVVLSAAGGPRPGVVLVPELGAGGQLARQTRPEESVFPGVKVYGVGVFALASPAGPSDPPAWVAADIVPAEAARLVLGLTRVRWSVAADDPTLRGLPRRWAAAFDDGAPIPKLAGAHILRALGG